MSTLARLCSYILPIVGVIVLIYLVLFLKQLIESLKRLSVTLDTANRQLEKLDAPLQTAEDISHSVDQVHQTVKDGVASAAKVVSENVDNAKEWVTQLKEKKAENMEVNDHE